MTQWYLKNRENPYSTEQIRSLLKANVVNADALISPYGKLWTTLTVDYLKIDKSSKKDISPSCIEDNSIETHASNNELNTYIAEKKEIHYHTKTELCQLSNQNPFLLFKSESI